MKKKDPVKNTVENIWPLAKKEIEKGVKNAKKMLAAGEKYLRELSEKGMEKTKKTSLSLKKEKLYYDLGKAVATASSANLSQNKKASKLIAEIKTLNRQIKKIK